MTSVTQPPAGWYPDPAGSGGERYWDGAAWSQVTRPGSGHPPPAMHQMRLAGWWWRVLASIIDSLVWLVPANVLSFLLAGDKVLLLQHWLTEHARELALGSPGPILPPWDIFGPVLLASLVSGLLFAVYRTVMVARFGATVGQLAGSMRVVRDGDPSLATPDWGTAALRSGLGGLFGMVPVLSLVNYLLPLSNAKRQTLHDMIAKTVVIKQER